MGEILITEILSAKRDKLMRRGCLREAGTGCTKSPLLLGKSTVFFRRKTSGKKRKVRSAVPRHTARDVVPWGGRRPNEQKRCNGDELV